jgi:hypothetical protein
MFARSQSCRKHSQRYERVSTMLTSNLDFAEWGGVFPANRVLGVDTWIGYPISGTLKWRHSAALRRHHIAGP